MDDKNLEIVEQLGALIETITTSAGFFQDIDLSFPELRVLLYIINSGKCIMSELVNSFKIPFSTATGIVDRLIENGFATRSRSTSDRRKVFIKATQKGQKLHQEHRKLIMKEMEKTLNNLTQEKRTLLLSSLKHVNDLLTNSSKNQKLK
jgi:DNA-binding MarR family transcriptional regulator